MRSLLCAVPVLIAGSALFAQTAAPVEFEVASVKPADPGTLNQVKIGVHIDGSRVSFTALSMKDYIRMAYNVKDYQISGPEWMAGARYDINATLPAGAKQDQVADMMKALLTERFHLTLHHDSKEFAVYALTLGKIPLKLTESAPQSGEVTGGAPVNVTGGGGRAGVAIDLGNGAYFSFANNKFEGRRLTMTYLADSLARFVDRPIVDMTGLPGVYDMTLNLTDEDYRSMLIRAGINAGVAMPPQARAAMEAASGDSLFTAIQVTGLKLDRRKAPLDVLVIDKLDKTPTAN